MNVPILPLNLVGYLIDLNGVRISGAPATFGENNFSATITDSGGNSMALFYWPTNMGKSQMNLERLAGPAGPVNMTGIVSVSTSGEDMVAVFSPLKITSVPEPPTLTLAGIGAAFILAAICRHGGVNESNCVRRPPSWVFSIVLDTTLRTDVDVVRDVELKRRGVSIPVEGHRRAAEMDLVMAGREGFEQEVETVCHGRFYLPRQVERATGDEVKQILAILVWVVGRKCVFEHR